MYHIKALNGEKLSVDADFFRNLTTDQRQAFIKVIQEIDEEVRESRAQTVLAWANAELEKAGCSKTLCFTSQPRKKERRVWTKAEKIAICDYYSNHTGVETSAKFNVPATHIHKWRKKLGYNPKVAGSHPGFRRAKRNSN